MEKLNSYFLTPFLGSRAMASAFLNELDAPHPLSCDHQAWIKALLIPQVWLSLSSSCKAAIVFHKPGPIKGEHLGLLYLMDVRLLSSGVRPNPHSTPHPHLNPQLTKATCWPLHWGHPHIPWLPNLKPRFTSKER